MRVELLCIGTELLSGKLDTNAAFIGERLGSVGLKLASAADLPDDAAALEREFLRAFSAPGIVIITGGLGPTFDDVTREAAAGALGRKLVFDASVMSEIEARFAGRKLPMPEENRKQAYILEGASVLRNPRGTAPGQLLDISPGKPGERLVVLLPGPPSEMQPMFESSVLPLLKGRFGLGILRSSVLHVCGLPESEVDRLIAPVVDAERKLDKGSVDFSILAHRSIIDVKTVVEGENELMIDETLHNIKTELRGILGASVYGEDAQTLESVVGELLGRARKTVSVAESCTGGLVCDRITNAGGSSAYFLQGAVTYSNASKISVLGVSPGTLDSKGAVSAETALEMARGMRKLSGSDYALSVTGIAGPSGGTAAKPLGLVYFGLAAPSGGKAAEGRFGGTRREIKERSANYALDMLRRELLHK